MLFDPAYAPFLGGEEIIDLLLDKIGPTDVVFDIGGLHGIHAAVFARRARQVMTFEPNPRAFEILQETIAVNRAQNIQAYRLAIGKEASIATLWGSGSGSSLRPGEGRVSQRPVQGVGLDDFAETRSTAPDVLKIDVEGGEYDVLAGARRCLAGCRVVCVELHYKELPKFEATPEMVQAVIADAGFIEVARCTPPFRGGPDNSRVHLLFEKR